MGARLAGAACIPAGDFERRATQQEFIMKKIALLTAVLAAALALQSYAGRAHAQGAVQAWVSATGSDSNTSTGCQASAPCQSFHAAIGVTENGGEVGCLGSVSDSESGATNVTPTITIDCHGAPAEYLAGKVQGINGFVINAPGNVVTLRGLNIDGTNSPGGGPWGLNGVVIEAAAVVNIEDCVIENFAQSAISVTTSADTVLNIRNTSIRNSANGISLAPTGGAVNGSIDHTMIAKMSGDGITTNAGSVFFTVTNSVIANAAGVGVNSGGTGTVLGVDSSSISNNHTAFATASGVIRISRNVIYDNTTNYSISGGTIATSGNNNVAVNGSTVPNGTITQQ
jgi:hypothetical protein